MTIKEQIATLPANKDLYWDDGRYGMSLPTNDLKALADSHTRLLAAAKAVDVDMQGADTSVKTRVEFWNAITDAEKL